MRNLRLIDRRVARADGDLELSRVCCVKSAQSNFLGSDSTPVICCGKRKEEKEQVLVGAIGDGRANSLGVLRRMVVEAGSRELVALFWSWDGLAVVYDDGAIHVLDEDGSQECVPGNGPDAAKIVCASRSPDGDVFALSDSESHLTLIDGGSWTESRKWNLSDESSLKTRESHSVGWGSEKSQFKGTGVALAERLGKAPAKPEKSSGKHDTDDAVTYHTWRGDGEFFAVSHVFGSNGRVLRVFDRRGDHLYSSFPGLLERGLAWQPTGSMIASSLHAADKLKIVLFEKNCRPWNEFVLLKENHEGAYVVDLQWNASSDVLCILLCRHPYAEFEISYTVQLWMRSNYNWDLKYAISSPAPIRQILWDNEANHKLHIIKPSECETLEWLPSIDASNDVRYSWVGVVSGSALRLTPLGRRVYPPPMCAQEVGSTSPISAVAFSSGGTSFASIDPSSITIYDVSCKNGTTGLYEERAKYAGTDLTLYHSWIFVQDKKLVAATETAVVIVVLNEEEASMEIMECVKDFRAFALCGRNGEVRVCDVSSNIFGYDPTSNSLRDTKRKLGAPCRQVLFDAKNDLTFGLGSLAGKLWCYEWEIMRGVTSARIHGDRFLLLTTGGSDCWLWCLNLERIVRESQKSGASQCSVEDLGVKRRVENGAKIITSCVESSAVILEMPRGNLETVHPRELLLSSLADLLNRGDYEAAYASMRRHRINLNVLCDHDPEYFLKTADKFVSVVKPDCVAQFLLDLTNEDVTTTLYRGSYGQERLSAWRQTLWETDLPTCKVDAVCETLRRVMMAKDEVFFMKPILATFARCSDPELGAALFFLVELKNVRRTESLVDEGLRYLMYLVDADTLFDLALGTYDLNMAVMVAERSQRDPKEWLPFLEQFRRLDSPYREYKVDAHLKRWNSALAHLSKCCETNSEYEEDCLRLISEKGLFSAALKLFPRGSRMHQDVCRRYAESLAMSGRRDEAGLVYSFGELRIEAARAFASCGDEHLALRAITGSDFEEEKTALGRTLANALANKRDFGAAARVVLDWCSDSEASFKFLLDGRLWGDALNSAQGSAQVSMVRRKLLDFAEDAGKSFLDAARQIVARAERLQSVFDAKFEEAMAAGDGENFPDVVSETETAASEATGLTNSRSVSNRSQRSVARKRKKEERKMRSLREGSRTEDLALITCLHSAIADIVEAKSDLKDALVHLVAVDEWDAARCLQSTYRSALDAVSSCCGKIWPSWLNVADLGLGSDEAAHFGPGATTEDVVASVAKTASYRKFVRSRFMFVEPGIRYPPPLKSDFVWSLSILASDHGEGTGPSIGGRTHLGFV